MARLGRLSGQGVPAQARDVSCPAVRLPLPSSVPVHSSAGAPQHPSRVLSQHRQPHPPTTENNALLWREVPSPQQSQQHQQQRSPLQQHCHLPEAEFNKLLNKEITACRSWRHLRALLHAHAQSMNSIHVSALVSRLAKVSPFTPATGFSEGGQSSNIPSLHTSGAVSIADAATPQPTVGLRSPNTVERRALDHFMGEVSQLVSSRLDTFDARALSNVLWAVAKLGFCPSHGLLQRFLFAAYVSMQDMQPQEVANLAWALATMRIHPGAPWTCRLLDHICAASGCMRPQELAHCTWAIQQLLEAHCDAQQQVEHRRERQQQQHCGSSQAQGAEKPAVANAAPAYPALELRYLGVLHAIQQSAEGALEGFKARELMMLLLSLHRMRQRLVVAQTQGMPLVLLQQAGGQQVRSMMASHHRLLVAALQSPQLTLCLGSLSPLDISNLAGLVARDVKLQQQAARQGTQFHTWHMIYEQRAIRQLMRAVVADSQARMDQYAPQDLLGLVTALSTMQAAGLPCSWLSVCAQRIGTTLLVEDTAAVSSASHPSAASSSVSSVPLGGPHNCTLIPHNSSSGSSSSSNGPASEGSSAAGIHGSAGGVGGSGGVGCLAPWADPRQHACAHATLASFLCGLAKLAARAGVSLKNSSSGSTRENSSGNLSGESDQIVGEGDSNGSSSSCGSCGQGRTGSLDYVAKHTLNKCLRAALPQMGLGKLAVVAWSMAELQGSWSPQLLAALQQRMQQLLLPHVQPSTALGTASYPSASNATPTITPAATTTASTRSSTPSGSAAGLKPTASPALLQEHAPSLTVPLGLNEVSMLLWGVERLQLQLDLNTARALANITASAATAAVGPLLVHSPMEAGRLSAAPLARNPAGAANAGAPGAGSAAASLAGNDEVGPAASAAAGVGGNDGVGPAASAAAPPHHPAPASPAYATPLHTSSKRKGQALPLAQSPVNASSARDLTREGIRNLAADGTKDPAADGKHQAVLQAANTPFAAASADSSFLQPQPVCAPPQAPCSPPDPDTAASTPPHSALPPPWNTISAPPSAVTLTDSTACFRQPQPHLPASAAIPSGYGTLSSSLMPDGPSSGGGLRKASRPPHQYPPPQAPSLALQPAATIASSHSQHPTARAHSNATPTRSAHAHRAAVAAAAAGMEAAPAVPGRGSSSGRLAGVQDLAWAATSLCTLQARSSMRIWTGTAKEVLEQALATAARSLQPQQLCTLVLALGQAQARPSEHLLAALLQQSLHLLPSLGPTHMSRLLCGLARLGYQPPPLWLAHTLSHTQALLPECSAEEASWMIWALAKLRVVLPSAWVHTWHHHLLAHTLYAKHSPRAAVRAAWALHALRLRLPDHSHALLVQAAAQSAEHLSREEALWLLRVAVGWQQYLAHEDWGRLLLQGVLQGRPPAVAVAEMPLWQQHILLSCMAHRHMRWTRCWNEWREVHRALGGRHTAGASGLVGIWRRTTRPRRWERRLWLLTSKTQRRKQRHLLALTWEAYKATKPRQLCSIWKFREKYWDK